MCARFVRVTPADVIASRLKARLDKLRDRPSHNIAPSQDLAVVIDDGGRRLALAKWGFLPTWARPDMKPMINARAETLDEKPSFRDSFRQRRCLIVADGFYEWHARAGLKIPYYFRLQSGEPFAMAGIYNEAGGGMSCAIVTTEADGVVSKIHERMPLIFGMDGVDAWLDKSLSGDGLKRMLQSIHAELDCYEVSRAMNDPHHDSPDNIRPVAA